jgi:hypothetical protein
MGQKLIDNGPASEVHRCGRNKSKRFSLLRFVSLYDNVYAMDKATAERRAAEIAKDIDGPLGRIPLERIFSRHIDFFSDLKAAGVTWPQIAALLNRAGISRKDGMPMTAAQIRATISRILAPRNEDKQLTSMPAEKTTASLSPQNQQTPRNQPVMTKQKGEKPSTSHSDIRDKMSRSLESRR